jgi:hypothetical protein
VCFFYLKKKKKYLFLGFIFIVLCFFFSPKDEIVNKYDSANQNLQVDVFSCKKTESVIFFSQLTKKKKKNNYNDPLLRHQLFCSSSFLHPPLSTDQSPRFCCSTLNSRLHELPFSLLQVHMANSSRKLHRILLRRNVSW